MNCDERPAGGTNGGLIARRDDATVVSLEREIEMEQQPPTRAIENLHDEVQRMIAGNIALLNELHQEKGRWLDHLIAKARRRRPTRPMKRKTDPR